MLARAPSREDGDSDAWRHGSGALGSVGGGSVSSPVKRPTKRVITASGAAREPPTGSCDVTIESRFGSSVSSKTTLVPEAGVFERGLRDRDVRGGHVRDRDRRRALRHGQRDRRPFRCLGVAARVLVDDDALRQIGRDVDPGDTEAVPSKLQSRLLIGLVHDVRDDHRLRSFRDVDADRVPSTTTVPGARLCATTVPSSRSELTSTTCAIEPELRERRHGAVAGLVRRGSGTLTSGFPDETSIVTVVSGSTRLPSAGRCANTTPSSTSEFEMRRTRGWSPLSLMAFRAKAS